MLKILHLSDLHIGKSFNKYPDKVQKVLKNQRFESLDRIVEVANDKSIDLLIIAGDLFDRLNIPKESIIRVCQSLSKFSGICLVLPGNHDYYSGTEDLWKTFEDESTDNTILLTEFTPYDLESLGYDAVIYPAHCHSKHSKTNNLDWIKDSKIDDTRLNIGISHGAIQGLSPDMQGEYFTMSRSELSEIPVDLWLLGHTHVPYPLEGEGIDERIFNAGVHEADGMNYRYEGSCFLIDISKEDISYERFISGKFRFNDIYEQLNSSLEEYLRKYEDDYENSLLRLNLNGYINEEEYLNREKYYDSLREKVFYLDIRDEDLKIRLSPEKISEKFVHGSFPEKLLLKLSDDEDKLQIAYDLIEESRN